MQEITLYADRGNAEAIGDMLMEAGASSYTTQDADADTPSESPLRRTGSGTQVRPGTTRFLRSSRTMVSTGKHRSP